MEREYLALVEHSEQLAANPQGVVKDPIMGAGGLNQPATTLYKTMHSNNTVALLKLTPQTGDQVYDCVCATLANVVLKYRAFMHWA